MLSMPACSISNKAEEVVEVSVRKLRAETAQVEKVISAALNAGVDKTIVSQSALKGGATQDEVMAAITRTNTTELHHLILFKITKNPLSNDKRVFSE